MDNTFTSVRSYNSIEDPPNPFLLSGDYAILHVVDFDLDLVNIALKVYEGSDSDLIWNDRKSGGKIQCWNIQS